MTAYVLPQLATRADIVATRGDIERLDTRLATEINRIDTRLSTEVARLEQKIELGIQRIESIVWRTAFAVLGGGLAIGCVLIRFMR
jgi:hypothetical protein